MPISERDTTAETIIETLRLTLGTFATKMGNDVAPSDETAVDQQSNMLSALKLIFRQEDDVFNQAFKFYLDWFRDNIKGATAVNARGRGLQRAKKISTVDHNAIVFLTNFAGMVADPKARAQVIARFEFGRLDRIWTTGGGGDKMRNYFAQL